VRLSWWRWHLTGCATGEVYSPEFEQLAVVIFGIFVIALDNGAIISSNISVMRQISRKNTVSWWWPAG
jgi:hypothetical protein